MSDQSGGRRLARACVRAPAKINLGLEIVGRRSDGYHELQSLFWPVSLCDEIELTPSETPSLRCEWDAHAPRSLEPLPQGPDNLAFRAMELARANAGGHPLSIRIYKRIPVGAGLGGGSSDAAAILSRYPDPDSRRRVALAASLGADVPFFLKSRPAWVTGIGEQVAPLELDAELLSLRFLLVIPSFSMPTAPVFRSYREAGRPFSPRRKAPGTGGRLGWRELAAHLSETRNDLEPAARSLRPQLGLILDALRGTGVPWAGLSGSGSTCCAILPPQGGDPTQDLREFFRSNGCRNITLETYQKGPASLKEPIEKGEQHGNHGSEGVPSQRGSAQGVRHDHFR